MNIIKKTCLLILSITAISLTSPGRMHAALPGDLNTDGAVSISEVQKVINSFLGLETGELPPSSVNSVSPSVVAANTVMYKKEATFTITGDNLLDGIVATASGACTTITAKPGGTSSSRIYTCVPSAVGPLTITIISANGVTVLKQFNFTVPMPQVTLETTMGSIVVELRPDKAPLSVDNFLQYVNDGFYDNTIFHRVVNGPSFFIVQGGGLSADGAVKPLRPAIILEAPTTTGLSNIAGTIGMARTDQLNTATSQFFFNSLNNTGFDTPPGYAVFGSVIQGMRVVEAIQTVPVDSTSNPKSKVTVISARQTNAFNVTIPSVPTGLTGTGGTKEVKLTWNSTPLATAYNVYWSTTPGVTIASATASGNKGRVPSNAASHTSLPANTTYYYIITAVNRVGESAPSNQVQVTTSP